MLDATNQPVKRPWPLNGEGKRKPDPTEKPSELTFKPYVERSWTALEFANPAISS